MNSLSAINYIKHKEKLILILLFFVYWIFLSTFAGGPQTWDELWYIDISLHLEKVGLLTFRYFHIYAQTFFIWISGEAFLGLKIMWGLEIAATTLLTYICAKWITEKSGVANGLLAVSFLSIHHLILRHAGTTWVDFTAMLMVTLGTTLYLYSLKISGRRKKIVLLFLGIVFFLGIRSKEVSVILAILFAGYLLPDDNIHKLKDRYLQIGYIMLGVMIGVVFFILLDAALLGSPLMSLKAGNLEETVAYFYSGSLWERFSTYYFSGRVFQFASDWIEYASALMLIPSLLHIVAFFRRREEAIDIRKKLLWLIPVGLMVLLIVIRRGVAPRYFLPAYPVLAILTAQIIDTPSRENVGAFLNSILRFVKGHLTWLISGFAVLLLLAIWTIFNGFIVLSIPDWLPPLAFVALLIISILMRKWSVQNVLIALLLAFIIFLSGVAEPIQELVNGQIITKTNARFAPLRQFPVDINCGEDINVYVSAFIHSRNDNTLSRDLKSTPWFFNLYYNEQSCDLKQSQFAFSTEFPNDLFDRQFDYVFLIPEDLEKLSPEQEALVTEMYDKEVSADGRFVYLIQTDGE